MAQTKKPKIKSTPSTKTKAKPKAHLTRQYIFLAVLVAFLAWLVIYTMRPNNPYNIQKPQHPAQPEYIDPQEEQ